MEFEWYKYLLAAYIFIVEIIKHRLIHIFLGFLLLIAAFIWRKYLIALLKLPHKLYLVTKRYFLSKYQHGKVKQIIKENGKFYNIRKDIMASIEVIRSNSTTDDQKFASTQYLLEFPSPEGFLILMEIAVKLNSHESRIELLCAMCDSAKEYQWYK